MLNDPKRGWVYPGELVGSAGEWRVSASCPRIGTALIAVLLMIGVVFSPGCSKEKMDEMVSSAKEKTAELSQATASVQEQIAEKATELRQAADVGGLVEQTMDQVSAVLPGSGHVTLQLDAPVKVNRADLQIIRVDEQRPIVLQVTSYALNRPIETFPCVLLHATSPPTSETFSDATPWLGKSLACQVFVQREAEGPIWASDPASPIDLVPRSDDTGSDQLLGTLKPGTLVAPDGTQLTLAAGELSAKLQGVVGGAW